MRVSLKALQRHPSLVEFRKARESRRPTSKFEEMKPSSSLSLQNPLKLRVKIRIANILEIIL